MKSIVISLGGSVFLSEDINQQFFHELVSLLQHSSNTRKIYVVIGGGSPARQYISRGRSLQFSESDLDEIGILITRVNATFLSKLCKDSNKKIPTTISKAINIKKSLVIMGGTTPGHSTDFVGAKLAKQVQAERYIIATNVDGIFDKDPRKHSDAIHIAQISVGDLLETYGSSWEKAGKNMVVDGPALQMIHDGNIPTVVLNGKNLDQLRNAIENKPFRGTRITV